MEIWKPVSGYEMYYAVSSIGRVKVLSRTILCTSRWGSEYTRVTKEKIKACTNNGLGYLQVKLEVDGVSKSRYVHRLVAEAFIPKIHEDFEVDHLDCDKSNNAISNLAWVSRKDNMIKCHQHNPHIMKLLNG